MYVSEWKKRGGDDTVLLLTPTNPNSRENILISINSLLLVRRTQVLGFLFLFFKLQLFPFLLLLLGVEDGIEK